MTHDCIVVEPLPEEEIPVDSEGDIQDLDVTDSDCTIDERMEGLEVQP